MVDLVAVECGDCAWPYIAQKVKDEFTLPTDDGRCRYDEFVEVSNDQLGKSGGQYVRT